MTQDLKNSLMIILKAYKEDKFTEDEVSTLLESFIDTKIVSYPYPVYPSTPTPWEITYKDLKPYCTSTSDTLAYHHD